MNADVNAQLDAIIDAPNGGDTWDREAAIAAHIRGLPARDAKVARARLGRWIGDDDINRATAAVGTAGLLGDELLRNAALREARRRGIHDDDLPTAVVPAWLAFHMRLLGALTTSPFPAGIEFMREVRTQAASTNRARRQIGISAWLRLCFIGADDSGHTLREAMHLVRQWDDPHLSRPVQGLFIGLWLREKRLQELRGVLTSSEFARVAKFANP